MVMEAVSLIVSSAVNAAGVDVAPPAVRLSTRAWKVLGPRATYPLRGEPAVDGPVNGFDALYGDVAPAANVTMPLENAPDSPGNLIRTGLKKFDGAPAPPLNVN